MKNCCHITVAHPAFDNRILRKECQTLAAAGYRVTLVAPGAKDAVSGNVQIVAIAPAASRPARFFISNWRALAAAVRQKADIYHFHDPDFLFFGFSALLKIITGRPVIYDAHEDYAQVVLSREWIPIVLRKPLSHLLRFWESFCAAHFADYVIAATTEIARNFNPERAADVKNYPRESDFLKINKRNKFPQDGETCRLIYAGGMEKVRGIKEAVRSLELVDNCRLYLMGDFGEKKFADEIKKLMGWAKVDFYGNIKFEAVVDNLKVSDIGIVCFHPIKRFKQSLPVKMFEYMAAGIPVIASNFSEWKKIIESGGCGICVDPLDPEKIAAAVNYLAANPQKALEMGARGRQAFLHEFNWRREGEKLVSIYARLMLNKDNQ